MQIRDVMTWSNARFLRFSQHWLHGLHKLYQGRLAIRYVIESKVLPKLTRSTDIQTITYLLTAGVKG